MSTATLEAPAKTALSARQRVEWMAAEMWALPHKQIMALIKHRVPKFKCRFQLEDFIGEHITAAHGAGVTDGHGWWVVDPTGGANSIEPDELPECMVFDAESTKGHSRINTLSGENDYHPFLAVAYGIPNGHDKPLYFVWVGPKDNSVRTIQMPSDRTLLTLNGGLHDSKFLSCEYEGEPLPIINVDVRALITMYRGICDEKQQARYQKYAANKRAGKSAPEWFAHATPASLDEAAKNILAIPIVKGINPLDPEAPQNILEYCAQDVSITMQLLQRVYPILRERFATDTTFVGMASTMGLSAYIGDGWNEFVSQLDAKEVTERKAKKAWLSYHKKEYSKLYVNDGAVKVGINPVGDPLSRFPQSGVWCHDYSATFDAFEASQESGYMSSVCLSVPQETGKAAVDDISEDAECVYSPLLAVRSPESIEYESPKSRIKLLKQFIEESFLTDVLHVAMTVANYEIMERGLDARICAFTKDANDVVCVHLMGNKDEAAQLDGIRDQTEELCLQMCDEVAADFGIAF